jgi:predicted dehydrogenase
LGSIGGGPLPVSPGPAVGELMAYQHVEGYADVSRTALAAVCDLNPSALDSFAAKWGDRFPGLGLYGSHREMLAAADLDMVSVAVNDDRHTQIVVDAAEAGVRGVICEKPFATTLAEADRMIAACAANGTQLVVNHTRRWYPDFLEARRIIHSGEIGKVKTIVSTWGGDRAMLFRNGAHALDGLDFFAESDPDFVIAELDDGFADYGTAYKGEGGRDAGKDPGLSGYVHYRNGVRAFLNMSKGTIINIEHDIVCERGRIRVGSGCAELWLRQDADDLVVKPFPLLRMRTTRGNTAGAIEELCDLLEHGGTPSCGGPEGRRAIELMIGFLQSAARDSAKAYFPIDETSPDGGPSAGANGAGPVAIADVGSPARSDGDSWAIPGEEGR